MAASKARRATRTCDTHARTSSSSNPPHVPRVHSNRTKSGMASLLSGVCTHNAPRTAQRAEAIRTGPCGDKRGAPVWHAWRPKPLAATAALPPTAGMRPLRRRSKLPSGLRSELPRPRAHSVVSVPGPHPALWSDCAPPATPTPTAGLAGVVRWARRSSAERGGGPITKSPPSWRRHARTAHIMPSCFS